MVTVGGAILLAALGIVLSQRQVRSLTDRLSSQLYVRAEQVRRQIEDDMHANDPALTTDERTGVVAENLVERHVAPLLPSDNTLCVTRTKHQDAPWSVPLFGPFSGWIITPTPRFVEEQRRTIWTQSATYLSVTALALGTLVCAMWFMMRLVQREISLAELKSNFVADVSHELKTPLALIRMYAETLQSGRISGDEKKREYYAVIARESTRLTNLINDILDFARIEAGGKEYVLQPTDAGKVVRETYEAYRPQLEHHGFEHRLDIAPGLPRIDADADALSQILVNLIQNSIKYSDDDKFLGIEVTGDVRRGRSGVLISLHDRGIGIRPDDRARLTEGFFRSQDTRVRQQGGTGLGLALVKRIIEAHHGSLDIESRLVKGSTFRVFFPASGATAV
jgi:signal transduction histidine kinase